MTDSEFVAARAFGPARATISGAPLSSDVLAGSDRFSLAIDVIDRVPRPRAVGSHARERFRHHQLDCRSYAHAEGVDRPSESDWTWPFK